MSKAFLAEVIQDSAGLTGTAANRAATDVVAAIVRELKKNGRFTLPSFGTFIVRKTKARKGLNPRPPCKCLLPAKARFHPSAVHVAPWIRLLPAKPTMWSDVFGGLRENGLRPRVQQDANFSAAADESPKSAV
jgi:DNA-binding protein HU-beta